MIKLDKVPYSLTPRNKDLRGTERWSTSFCLYEDINQCRFVNLLRCYTNRKNIDATYSTLTERHAHYWNAYINASECRAISKYFTDAIKRGTVYMIEKPYVIKLEWDRYEAPTTMVITQKPYKEETLFLKALCDDGIRSINGKEKYFFHKVMKFMRESKGVWF